MIIYRIKGGIGNHFFILMAAIKNSVDGLTNIYVDATTGFSGNDYYNRRFGFSSLSVEGIMILFPLASWFLLFFVKFVSRTKLPFVSKYIIYNKYDDPYCFPAPFPARIKPLLLYYDGYFHLPIAYQGLPIDRVLLLLGSLIHNTSASSLGTISLKHDSLSIHLRRYTDLSSDAQNLPIEYYSNAINILLSQGVIIKTVVVVSQCVPDSLSQFGSVLYSAFPKAELIRFSNSSQYDDFLLLMQTRYTIISNSSFSATAALFKTVIFRSSLCSHSTLYPKTNIRGSHMSWDSAYYSLPTWLPVSL